jgi:hypothetical protein
VPALNQVVVRVHDADADAVIAVQAMGGAADSRVVGALFFLHHFAGGDDLGTQARVPFCRFLGLPAFSLHTRFGGVRHGSAPV